MSKRTVLRLLFAALAAAVVSTLAGASPQGSPAPAKTATHTAAAHAPAAHSSASLLKPDSLKLQAPAVFTARFTTSKGDFDIEVTRAWAPRAADRFYNLVKYHFFDGAAFFRVVEGFMVQFGLSPRPEVTRVWESATINDDPVTQSNTRGMISFATRGPNSRTTQVFINFADNSRLDGMGFSPFARISRGMDVVDKLYAGYGDGPPSGTGPDQGMIHQQGKAYLEKSFPLLDTIKTAVILPPAPVATSKPAAASK